jgi:hypothetical protein
MGAAMQIDSLTRVRTRRAAFTVTLTVVALLAFAGFEHGMFEALQGNRPTGAPAGIPAIGDDMMWWEHGTEDAFTLIPNFLATGLAAMAVSVFIFFWAAFFVNRKRGVLVLLLLFILLVLVGGGIGFIPFFLLTCAYATRLNRPLRWWRKTLGPGVRKLLSPLWPWALALTAICWLVAIEIAVFGYFPGLTDADVILYVCWSFLLATMFFINISYISAFAADIERDNPKREML